MAGYLKPPESPKEESSLKTAFLSLPAQCTGDIWHTATAHLLWANKPLDPTIRLVVLISVPDNVDRRILATGTGRVAAMYDYLCRLGAKCIVARLATSALMDDEDCENAVANLGAGQIDELVASQGSTTHASFLSLWDSLVAIDWTSRPAAESGSRERYALPPIHHYAATTMLASYFQPHEDQKNRVEQHQFLRKMLLGDLPRDGDIWTDAAKKVDQLRALISKVRASAGPSFSQAKAVLFVYRLVDRSQPDMNPHQNASGDVFDQVRDDALLHGHITIRIPHGMDAESMDDDDLDLFDERSDQHGSGALKDKRYTVAFWAKVFDMPEVFGVVGSRTGSLDIAAFVGLNCFEWDEPLLHEIRGVERGEGWDHLRLGRRHLEKQVPQHLRLLAQSPIMTIGTLDPESFDPKASRYTRIDSVAVNAWLGGKVGVICSEMPQESIVEARLTYIR